MLRKIWNRLTQSRSHKAVILMYHQVTERQTDPWQLAVDPVRFESQLQILKKNYDVVSVEALVAHIRAGTITKNMVAITFDDGFLDNYTWAMPLLEWYKLPATFYFTSKQLKNAIHYWWDELETIIFHSKNLPSVLVQPIGKEVFRFTFRLHSSLTPRLVQQIKQWTYGQPIANERVGLYLKLWERLQPLLPEEQEQVLKSLRSWAGITALRCLSGSTMQSYQLQKIGANPLFSIGAHTVNHVLLAAHSESIQHAEIHQSKIALEKVLGKKISGFAYPHGSYNEITKLLLKKEGFDYSVSTEPSFVTRYSDPLALPRLQVKNWASQEFSFHLNQQMQ